MAVLHGVALTLLAKYAVYHPTDQTLVTSLALAVLVGAAALWSALDAWRGLADRGRAWFIAALVTGIVSGILYVIGRAVFVDQTGVSELGGALTGGAAFSALLVLVPAGLGLFVGGRIGRSKPSDASDDDSDDSDDSDDEVPAPSPSPRPRRRVREEVPAQPRARAADVEPVTRPQRRIRPAEGRPAPSPRMRPRGEKPRT